MSSPLTSTSEDGASEPLTSRRSSRRAIAPISSPLTDMANPRLEGKGKQGNARQQRESLPSGRRTSNRLAIQADVKPRKTRPMRSERTPVVEIPRLSPSERELYVAWGPSTQDTVPNDVTQTSVKPSEQPSSAKDSQQYDPSMIDDSDELDYQPNADNGVDLDLSSELTDQEEEEDGDRSLYQESGSDIRGSMTLKIRVGQEKVIEKQVGLKRHGVVSESDIDHWALESSETAPLSSNKRERAGKRGGKSAARRSGRTRKNIIPDSETSERDQSSVEDPLPKIPRIRLKRYAGEMQTEEEGEDEVDELQMNWDNDSESPRTKPRRRGRNNYSAPIPPSSPSSTPEHAPESTLAAHRDYCERCSRPPTAVIAEQLKTRKKKPGPKRKKVDEDDDIVSDGELVQTLGGWVTCKSCCIATHYDCLGGAQKKTLLQELHTSDVAAAVSLVQDPSQDLEALEAMRKTAENQVPKRKEVRIDEEVEFICARCNESGRCFVCWETGAEVHTAPEGKIEVDTQCAVGLSEELPKAPEELPNASQATGLGQEKTEQVKRVLFRCRRCKLGAHYEHLRPPKTLGGNPSLPDVALQYQTQTHDGNSWTCHLCRDFVWNVDIIIAWRSDSSCPLPANPTLNQPLFKADLPREYLIKFQSRPFRHVVWVPHAWLSSIAPQKLRRFLEKGPLLEIVTNATMTARGDELGVGPGGASIAKVLEMEGNNEQGFVGPEEDAESNLPELWSTIDRVLDIKLLRPTKEQINPKTRARETKQQRKRQRILSISPESDDTAAKPTAHLVEKSLFELAQEKFDLPDGMPPPIEEMVEIEEWEALMGRDVGEDDVDEIVGHVAWIFVKWEDLQYDQACWDTPPPLSSPFYPAFKAALGRFLRARHITIPVLTPAQALARDAKAAKGFVPPQDQPACKLMPFQMEGLQWLLYKHFKRESCILADDMGLGKTVQIASVLGYLGSAEHQIYPCLVVVPNSTITNWVREFEKWSPHLRVVPFYGEKIARQIIMQYELFHKGQQGKVAGLKAHIVLTTYDMVTGSEFKVFSTVPRWEVLCVDEGQRLKSDESKIFNKLKTLKSVHRILLTGTPLNNNIRELFNLLNFLDRGTFSNLKAMEAQYENLDEAKVQKLHEMIKPYILRRIKADVLRLPPKVEIIVPITLSPMQKQVYKGIFERNAEVIQEILRVRQKRSKAKKAARITGPTSEDTALPSVSTGAAGPSGA
ncbi:hypothetical protein L198_01848 [Cryptococcus wingfieldii CBS 7118]|uniref:Helicase ATP-binding domain-containing protein n=1 Tax=Cryptococcus wingfieldii CBS 7118 TaxID=1295528 RepID=A0A1E3JWI6_9TREE|nr:hypothetical protein L198_01848 [Cryptococcus wingfieldii CBS 7118]ODO05160.1 hypothetical protein L198_01848 [Cryptococcus wingfieldii CBS 7118]